MYCGRNCRCLNCKNGSPEPSSGSATPPAAAIAAVTAAAAVGTTIMTEAQDMQQHELHHQKNSLKAISLSFSSSEEKVSVKEEEETTATKEKKTDIDPSSQDEDQLAIMAAVAMTELLTGNTTTTTTATTTNPNKPSIRSSCTTTRNTATTTVVDAHHDETAKIDNSKTVNETSKSNDDGSINDKNDDKNRGSLPMKKRKKAGQHYRVSSLSAVAAISPESNGNVVFMDDTKKRAITTEAVEDNNAIITNELQEEQDTSKRPRQSKSVELESPVRKLDVSNTNSNNSGNNGSRNKEVSPITTTVKENNDDEMDTEQEQEKKKPLSSSPNSYDYKEREVHFSASSHYGGAQDPTYHNSSMIESPYYSNSPPVSVYHQTQSYSCRPLMNEHQQQHQKYHHYHPQVSPSSSSSMTPTSMRYSSGVSSDATGAAYYSNQFQYAHPYPSPPVIMNRYYSSPSPTNHHHYNLSPPPGLAAAAAAPPPHIQQPYKDVMKGNGGLPKALSFRKICSKCGRTRGEHGERGFGNNCTFQDCGKCGASCAVHDQCKTTMGILCNLTVEQGAIPGAADAYERKIRALAVRAESQRNRAEERLVVATAAATQHPYHHHHRHQYMNEESTIPASKVAQSTSTPSVTAPISATSTTA